MQRGPRGRGMWWSGSAARRATVSGRERPGWARLRLARPAGGRPGAQAGSGFLGHHRDGAGGAFGDAEAAALAVVVVDHEAPAGAELDDGVVGADAVAVVALEA